MKTKKFLFYVFFALELFGLGGLFWFIIDSIIKNLKGVVVSSPSKQTMIILGVLLAVGFIGLLLSNKPMDQLNKIEDEERKALKEKQRVLELQQAEMVT